MSVQPHATARFQLPRLLGASHLEALREPPIGDAATMTKRATFWAGKAEPGGKTVHSRQVSEALADPQRVREGIARRSASERTILGVLARYGGGVSEAILERELAIRWPSVREAVQPGWRRISPPTASGIGALVTVGLVERAVVQDDFAYTYSSDGRASVLLVPEIVRPHLTAVGPVAWPSPPQAREAPRETILRDPSEAIAELREVAHALGDGGPWRVTNAGLPHATVLPRLLKALPHLAVDDASGMSNRVGFAYAILKSIGAIECVDDGALRGSLRAHRLDHFFRGDPIGDVAALVAAWVSLASWDEVSCVLSSPGDMFDDAGQARERAHNAWRLGALAHAGDAGAAWLDAEAFLEQLTARESPPDPHGYYRRSATTLDALRTRLASLRARSPERTPWGAGAAGALIASAGKLRGLSLFILQSTSMASSTPLAAGAVRSLSESRNCGT